MKKLSDKKLARTFYFNVPTTTAQQHKVSVVHGRPIFYDPPKLKEAKMLIKCMLAAAIPKQPIEGALQLNVVWAFQKPKTQKSLVEYRVARPDLDNLQKALKDIMTELGFWHDDAQVVIEHTTKVNAERSYLHIEIWGEVGV